MASAKDLASEDPVAFCSVCRNFDFHCPLPGGELELSFIILSRTLFEVDQSADRGCTTCWVWANIARSGDESIRPDTDIEVDLSSGSEPVVRRVQHQHNLDIYRPGGATWWWTRRTSESSCHSTERIDSSSGLPKKENKIIRSIPVRTEISESAWSDLAQKFARDCIRTCTQDHKLCRLRDTMLPTRVIEVGNIGDEKLRLLETQASTIGQYTALSYCWGGNQPLKTTCANINNLKAGQLLLSHLPQTLVDAVHVTRSLGIQYLWVDALCIIQDSIEDWEKEAEQMAIIYEKAYLVIAASSSSSAKQGFLGHQRQSRPYHLTLPEHYGMPIVIGARRRPCSGFHDAYDPMDPLAQRAWAFQEQHMSTRCLIFSIDELQWMCRTNTACECGAGCSSVSYPVLPDYCDDTRQAVAIGGHTLQNLWRKAVMQYSPRKLTSPDDKLPAFSGLASIFGARMKSRYLAGLWEEDIILDLAWTRVSIPLKPTPLPKSYRAPSFSWASINDGAFYNSWEYKKKWTWVSCSSVSESESVVSGRNPFGKVSDAWIKVRGPILQGIFYSDGKTSRFRSDDGIIDLEADLDSAVVQFICVGQDGDQKISVRRSKSSQPCGEVQVGGYGKDDELSNLVPVVPTQGDAHSNLNQATVWLLHLGKWVEPEPKSLKSRNFMLLLGSSPRDPEKYERIGTYDKSYYQRGWQPLAEHDKFTMQTITIL